MNICTDPPIPPVWAKEDTRVGWYGELGQIVEASNGYQKLNALLSGMSTGACQDYIRGWRRCAQYCNLRGESPWIIVGDPEWGEMIFDFIMFEHAVLGLKPSTTAGEFAQFVIST